MTRTTPWRLITRQCSHIGFTLLRTFIPAAFVEFIEQLSNITLYRAPINPARANRLTTGGSGEGQDTGWTRLLDRDGVLEVGTPTPIEGDHCPPIGEGHHLWGPLIDHRLDREDHPWAQ